MGLIAKLTGHSSSSDTAARDSTKTAAGHTQPDLDNRTGTTTTGSHTSTGAAAHTAPHSHHGTGAHTTGDNRSTGEKARDVLEPGHTGSGPAAHHGTGVGSATSSSSTTTSSNSYDNTRGTGIGSTTTGAHSATGSTHQTGDSRTTGEKVKDAVLPGHHGSTSTSSTHGHDSSRSSTGSSSSVHQQGGRLGELHLNEHDLSSAKGEHTVKHAAPVVAEHVHDRYEHVDKTRVEELRQKTEVKQTVQPVYDEVKHGATHERVDHGLEVHEHGHRGLDREAEAELARKREQIAREHRSTHDEETRQTSLRPDVNVHHRPNVVEEVVPVIEKDIYRPHEIEHVKHEVHVHHEAPVVKSTTVAAPISIAEYEKVSGVKLHGLQSSDHATRDSLTTDKHTHGTHGGISGGREGNVDTTSSYDNRSSTGTHGVGSHSSSSTTGTHSTGDNRTMGEKIKDTVLPGHHSSSSSSGTTTTGSSSGTGYDNSRSTTGTHGSTGMGSTSGTGVTGSNNYGDNRTTGEKVKDTVTPGHNTQTGTHNTGVPGQHTGVTGQAERGIGSKIDQQTGHPGMGQQAVNAGERATGHNTQTGAMGTHNTGASGQHTGVTGQAERGIGSKIDQQTGHPGMGQQAVNAGERATGHNTQNAQGQKFAGGHVLPNTGNTNTNTRL